MLINPPKKKTWLLQFYYNKSKVNLRKGNQFTRMNQFSNCAYERDDSL